MAVALLIVLFLISSSLSVPALSAIETVEGEVVGYAVMRFSEYNLSPPDLILYVLTIRVKGEKPAFMRKDRSTLKIFSKKPVPSWIFGKRVILSVKYAGDERGGNYWLVRIREVR